MGETGEGVNWVYLCVRVFLGGGGGGEGGKGEEKGPNEMCLCLWRAGGREGEILYVWGCE